MRTFIRSVLLCAVVMMLLGGCAPGSRYAFLFMENTVPSQVTDNPVVDKSGSACAVNILGLVFMGDASIAKAARGAEISRVGAVNSRINSFAGIYAVHCTVVEGS